MWKDRETRPMGDSGNYESLVWQREKAVEVGARCESGEGKWGSQS